jgi:hypothetical protein
MQLDLSTAWPAFAFAALLYAACLRASVVEWIARRKARRRARVLCAPFADLTPAIREASIHRRDAERETTN